MSELNGQMEQNECYSQWKGYPEYKIKDKCEAIPHYNYDIIVHHNIQDSFYIQVFDTWNKLRSIKVETYEDICRQNLWNNKYITVVRKTIKYSEWINHGIIHRGYHRWKWQHND